MTCRRLSDLFWTPLAKVVVTVVFFALEHQPQSKRNPRPRRKR